MIEKTEVSRGQILLGKNGSVDFGDWEGIQRYANVLVNAGLVAPQKNEDRSGMIARTIISINLGRRIGLPPEEAVQSIYVVNCRANLFGDAPLAICRQHPQWVEKDYDEFFEVDGKRVVGNPLPEDFKKPTTRCVVTTRRRDGEKKTGTFSVGDAQQAGLFGKNGSLYGPYPHRLIRFRARGYALRDNFGDALKGLGIRELVDEEPAPTNGTPEPPTGRINLRANGSGQANPSAPIPADPTPPAAETYDPPGTDVDEPSGQTAADEPPTQEDMARQDEINDLRERIGQADTEVAIQAAAVDITRREDYLGRAVHGELVGLIRERRKQLAAPRR